MIKKLMVFITLLPAHALTIQSPEELLTRMSLREKIGQLFVVAAASNFSQPTESLASAMTKSRYTMDPDYVENLVREHGIGGVIFLYKSDPATQMKLAKRFNDAARIPLLITQDCEWGLAMRLDIDPTKVVRYPRNMTLGAIKDEQLVYEVAREIGNQCAAIGVHMNFAPVADVNNNKDNPVIHDRSFGDDPHRVARLATLFTQGLTDAGVIACAKHYPGHGDTNDDSHLKLPTIAHNVERLNKVEFVPFRSLIDHGISAIMHAHLNIPALDNTGTPSSLSYPIITTLLKKQWGYKGLNVTDGLGMDAVSVQYAPGELERAAFLAGNDILLCPLDVPRAVALIAQDIAQGRVSEEDLNNRVLTILRTKKWAREHQHNQEENSVTNAGSYITRPDAYALQKRAYREAITMIKNTEHIVLDQDTFKKSHIIHVGTLPENIFAQACARNDQTVSVLPPHPTTHDILTCMSDTQHSETTIIAVGSMNKHADRNFGIAESTRDLIAQLRAMHKKIVVVLFGTPYSIPLVHNADAILVAYEDAPAAQEAVVATLRGEHTPTGMLPVHVS